MHRPSAVDAMLLGTVLLWALNVTVTKYVFEHGWQPLAYATIRYFIAVVVFWAFTYLRERSLWIARRDLPLVLLAALMIFVNQISFVYGVKLSHASTVALLFGTTPIFVGVISLALRLESLARAFWIGAVITFGGVALIALASGGVGASLKGTLIALCAAPTWAGYSLAIAPLLRRYSPYRISAVVLAIGWVPIALVGIPQVRTESFAFPFSVWLGFSFAVVGPLFLTTILWFTAIKRVGASRASLVANLQPFFAVVFALILLGESLTAMEIAGGALIFAGIAFERIARQPLPAQPVA